ncbi:type I DNA topoisomerase [Candidatus Dojkabacteria bacterium]|nr:type I DNA topoisomerase [Candidatus Dojkabacteria bacterium]
MKRVPGGRFNTNIFLRMNLVVVESPAKAKTIEKYLGQEYKVRASMGHVVDLPTKELAVDTENNFEPTYTIAKGKNKIISALKKELKDADTLVLAVDPDREGEAIGWHIARELGVINDQGEVISKSKNLKRIVFHEITKEAILEAMSNAGSIDMSLVNAQQARRVLDRLVGYKLSPLLWKKIRYGLSAGRVQSAAVRLVVDREREREKFEANEYWSVEAYLSDEETSKGIEIDYVLSEKNQKRTTEEGKEKKEEKEETAESSVSGSGFIRFELAQVNSKKPKLGNKSEVEKVVEDSSNKKWEITSVVSKDTKKYPSPPFTTSTLQQAASNRMGFSAKKTMQIAQKLYEAGHITYMRTDSTNLSESAIKNARSEITSRFGKEYVPEHGRHYKTRSKVAQEAHEAIRPTHFNNTSAGSNNDEKRLYDLIWKKAISSQMSEARLKNTTLENRIDDYLYRASGQRIIFPGFLKVYPEMVNENILPEIKTGEVLFLEKLRGIQHYTKPPARFTEATLIKELEKHGIGRPSTYAPIMSTIQDRGYIGKDGRYLFPLDVAMAVNDLLVENFSRIVDFGFTADMEDDLDSVANGQKEWVKIISDFYLPFEKELKQKEKTIDREDYTNLGKSDEKCPVCGKPMKIKLGRFGKFLSCTDFPNCKGMKSFGDDGSKNEESSEFIEKYESAPKGSDGKTMILKTGRFGQFWAHPDYPNVKETAMLLLKEKCPESGHNLVERKGKWGKIFISCSGYPKCRYIKKK